MRAQSEIDNIIGVKFEALDKGFVRVVDYMGNDSSVVQAARVSYGEGTKKVNEDKGLIDYLMRHQHNTPFEMTTIKFHIKCPIFVARQWMRHRTGCLAGDSKITFVDKNGRVDNKIQMTVDELYDKWHNGEICTNSASSDSIQTVDKLIAEGNSIRKSCKEVGISRNTYFLRKNTNLSFGKRNSKSRIKNMNLRVFNEDTLKFEIGHINDVIYKGEQDVYEVTLNTGNVLRMTKSHKCFTDKGWLTLAEVLKQQAKLFCTPKETIQHANKDKNPVLEEWKDILGFEGKYKVSNTGKIKNFKNTRNNPLPEPKEKKITITRLKRSFVGLSKNGKTSAYQVSHLVAKAFLSNPENLPYVCHIDDNSANNYIENLYWGNEETNKKDACKNQKLQTSFVELADIVSCDFIGTIPTYDLSVEGKWHNFLANGIVVHNSFNEISARYTEVKDEFYSPEISNIKPQSKTNHQGREESESFDIVKALDYQISMKDCSAFDYEMYQMLINDGVAKEIARTVLPVSQYTEFYWSLNLRNLFHFLHLRSDSHAQYEIRVYADIIASLVETWVPHCFEAFEKYQLGAKTLSAPAIKMLQKMAKTGESTSLEESGMGKREYQDFLNLLKGN